MQLLLPIQINAIRSCVLRNDINFLYPLTGHLVSLFQDILYRSAIESSSYARNGAIAAIIIATVRNPEIGIMSWGQSNTIPPLVVTLRLMAFSPLLTGT